jgi:SAM-dependent methyltransferase
VNALPTLDARQTPRVARLQSLFDNKHRLCGALIGNAITSFGQDWAADFECALASTCADDNALEVAAQGYAAFAFDSMRRQKAFELARAYPHKTYAEAAGEVYFNADHMMREYLPGLLLSHFLWPHHYRQLQFFDTTFVGAMRLSPCQRFAEVGVGTALYSRRLLERLRDSSGTGYDISPSSCQFARDHIKAAGAHERYTVFEQDIAARPIAAVSWLVCVEVLEHLERPIKFLKSLRTGLTSGGKGFITAALNAAHADHAYLYRSANEVWQHLGEAGFAVEQSFVGASHPSSSPDASAPLVAAFVVC